MYYIMEIQKTTDEQCAYLMQEALTRDEAESKWHTILASAAISAVPMHSASIITDEGVLIATRCYEHQLPGEEEN